MTFRPPTVSFPLYFVWPLPEFCVPHWGDIAITPIASSAYSAVPAGSAYGITCCNLCPFECKPAVCIPSEPIVERELGGYGVRVYEPTISTEYLLCACGCCHYALYVPETSRDAFGMETDSV